MRRAPCPAIVAVMMAFSGIGLGSEALSAAETHQLVVVTKTSPIQEPAAKLEPEVLDFRYRPGCWQTCIGLTDDPYKTIVGSDGGLYYEYGKRGPAVYNNGQGMFGTRVITELEADGDPGPVRQSLFSPRIPIVVTERQRGDWLVHQEAWSGVLEGETVAQRSPYRVDYLWLTATNRGTAPKSGTVALDVGTVSRLELDPARLRLRDEGRGDRVFCQFSRPCTPPAKRAAEGVDAAMPVETRSVIEVRRNWAHPTVPCGPWARHVLIGFGQPLDFRVAVRPGQRLSVAIGLIEGWHDEPGKRPLSIEVEGQPSRTLDLAKEPGRNVPVVLLFSAADKNGDGKIAVSVRPAEGAVDKNTVLSGLWFFPAEAAPRAEEILSGKTGPEPLARVDADHLPAMPKPLRLSWDTGTLAAGESFDLLVALPQGDEAKRGVFGKTADAAAQRRRAIEWWTRADLPYDRIAVPDPAVQDLLDSCIRNLYQAREIRDGRPTFQVGPTCYRGTWAADGAFIVETIAYLGRANEARTSLEGQVDGDDGPSGVEFSKKSGLRLWMVWRHAQLTGDRAWLGRMWPRVEREVNQIIEYRNTTRDDPSQANFGLMPIGLGDGGLGGRHREYTNVYWTLAGLKAAIDMARWRNDPALAAWQAEYADYWQAFDKARNRDKLVDDAGNTYVPVTMKGEEPQLPQRGAWAFLQSVFPGRIFQPDDKLMLGTIAMLDANQREGLIYGTGWIADGIWNYAGSFYAHAHLWLGHGDKAAATLYAFANHASPLLCWREEQNPVGQPPHYVGDMPHNWASAEFIRLVRHLLILERGGELHVLEGLPRAWTRPGEVTELKEIPTSFGPVSVKVQMTEDGRSATITVDPPRREPVDKLVVHLERFGRPITEVRLDGKPIHDQAVALPPDHLTTLEVEFRP